MRQAGPHQRRMAASVTMRKACSSTSADRKYRERKKEYSSRLARFGFLPDSAAANL